MSQTKEFDLLVFIGRFQPFHKGHLAVIREGFKHAQRLLILVGSANSGRTLRNPFTFEERRKMISRSIAELPERPDCELLITALDDHLYNEAAWIENVQHQVEITLETFVNKEKPSVGIIGHSKDRSSYYLRLFPGYRSVDVPGVYKDEDLIDSTVIRNMVLSETSWSDVMFLKVMPHAAVQTMRETLRHNDFIALLDDAKFIRDYKEQWKGTPFPPTFITVDAVVQCCGRILMIIRGERPGRGSLALPGGFIHEDEKLLDACIRELYEETQIRVPRAVMHGSLRKKDTFDHPHRSSRGRTVTHAFRFDLADKDLPKVRGGDDAASALWVPISAVQPQKCYEDHGYIIRSMLGVS